MAKKTINWDEYNIRTLAYYQKQGGVYSDLITVLQKARTDYTVLGRTPRRSPTLLLNIASYIVDCVMADKDNSAKVIEKVRHDFDVMMKDDCSLVFSIVIILLGETNCEEAISELTQYISPSLVYKKLSAAYNKEAPKNSFPLRQVLPSERQEQYEATIKQNTETIKYKEEIIDSLKTTIAEQSSKIDDLKDNISRLEQENEIAQAAVYRGSALDRKLTLDYIIGQIELKRTYENSRQLIDLLKGKLMRIATEEEVAKIEQIEQRMLDASVPNIHNDIRNSQVFQAPVHNPTFQLPYGFTNEMLQEAIELYYMHKNDGYTE